MVISCIGDSLTQGDYGIYGKRGIANVQPENYPYFLTQLTNAEVRNFGKCGFTSTGWKTFYDNGNVNLEGSDIIIILLGTNGGLDDKQDIQGNEDYKYIVDVCKKDAPNAKIFLCTPPHVTKNPEYSNCGYADQVEKAVAFVRNFAKKEQLPLIDTALCPFFTEETEHIMQPNDGLHFGKEGYQKLAEFIFTHL